MINFIQSSKNVTLSIVHSYIWMLQNSLKEDSKRL